MATTRERLEQVRTAIDTLVTGGVQSYTLEGQAFTLLRLDDLRALEAELERRLARETRRSRITLARPGWG